ncbi:MAG: hypothetical protein JNM36_12405 [Chitinophagales bacterium]|jgi:hypothetical protein|nr:hypothetical protein [Chitinophagales bacterium]
MKKLFLLYFLFCFSCSIALAQDNNNWLAYSESESVHSLPDSPIRVQVANYVFRKFDSKRRILAFTQADADRLREFFLTKQGVLACETHTLDKSIKVLTRADGNGYWGLDHQQLIDELATLGYVPASYKSGFQELFLEAHRNHQHKKDDCTDCADVKVSEELRKKFEDMDYGDKQIDFGGSGELNEEEIDPKLDSTYKSNDHK